jgi:hypothetical protein
MVEKTGAVLLAPGAEENGLCGMLADLVRQNLESKPHKRRDFDALRGSVGIVAEDAEVALTMRFEEGKLTLHDGIVGVPDVTIRGSSDSIVAMSNMPLATRFALPVARDAEGKQVVKDMMRAMREGSLRIHGMFLHLPMVMRLTRVMSVNG